MANLFYAIAVFLIIAWFIAVFMVIAWLIGFIGFHIGGGLIPIILVIAGITILLSAVKGKKTL